VQGVKHRSNAIPLGVRLQVPGERSTSTFFLETVVTYDQRTKICEIAHVRGLLKPPKGVPFVTDSVTYRSATLASSHSTHPPTCSGRGQGTVKAVSADLVQLDMHCLAILPVADRRHVHTSTEPAEACGSGSGQL